jgi:hypothetical protein
MEGCWRNEEYGRQCNRQKSQATDELRAGRQLFEAVAQYVRAGAEAGTSPRTADRLMEESAKAQANGRAYAELTARNAALAVDRRRRKSKPGHVSASSGRRFLKKNRT